MFPSSRKISTSTSEDYVDVNVKKLSDSVEAWSTNSESPTPTNSVTDRSWTKEPSWIGVFGEEHRQLLGTEEESSDRHSSDDETQIGLETIYKITSEQRDYYITQFKSLLDTDANLLSAQTAKAFFEKSRIRKNELDHIWKTCDVTPGLSLNLAEFIAIMHLIVLRRNSIPLPNVLPQFLHPNVLKEDLKLKQISADDGDNPRRMTFNKPDTSTHFKEPVTSEWTKFSESPASTVSSPLIKPLNFDMMRTSQAIVSDPQILHPVALRITPLEHNTTNQMPENNENSLKQFDSLRDFLQSDDVRSSEVPLTKEIVLQYSGCLPLSQWDNHFKSNENLSFPCLLNKKKISSIPLKFNRHGRSSSLDLGKLKCTTTNEFYKMKNVSNQNLDFLNTIDYSGTTLFLKSNERISAFEVYRGKQIIPSLSLLNTKSHLSTKVNDTFPSAKENIFYPNDFKSLNGIHEVLQRKSIENDYNKKREIFKYLRDYNKLILSLCKDLSAELLIVQNLKKETLYKLETILNEFTSIPLNINT